MFLKAAVASIPLLSSAVTASPLNQPPFKPSDQKTSPARGPSFVFNETSPAVNLKSDAVAAYALQESYDASNWFSKFSVQAVSLLYSKKHYNADSVSDR